MGYDVTMIIGESYESSRDDARGLGKWVYPIAELELKCIGNGPLTKRIHRHSYSNGKGYWLYAQPRGERHRETMHESEDTNLYSGGDREPTAEERYAHSLEDDVFRIDNHGNGLRPVPIKEVIALLESEIELDDEKDELPYRRFEVALAMLRQFKRHWHKEIAVLFYGN